VFGTWSLHAMDGSKLGARKRACPVKEVQQSSDSDALSAASFVLAASLALAPVPAVLGNRCDMHVVDPNKPWMGVRMP
jgi:hypothetical protein